MNVVPLLDSLSDAPRSIADSPALAWFNSLQSGNPGARARLRRCRSSVDALLEPAAIRLAQRIGVLSEKSRHDDARLHAALDLARVLAHVKTHDGNQRVMRSAGWRSFPGDRKESDAGEDRPILSQVRFRRLISTERGEPLIAAFVRLVRQLDGAVNVTELAKDFLDWSHPERALQVRRKWAFDYYGAGVATPPAIDSSTESEADL